MPAKNLPARIPYVHPDDPAKDLAPGKPFLVDGLDWSWAFVVFKDIEGFPGYKVGSDGSVWSAFERRYTKGVRGGKRAIGTDWKRMKLGRARQYACVNLYRDDTVRTRLVHQLVLETFVGPCPQDMEGCHFDDDPLNNRSWNLRWDTSKANHDDAIRNGRSPWGESHGNSKLTAEIVRDIRAAYASREMNQPQLARKFGVGQTLISKIVLRRIWIHLD